MGKQGPSAYVIHIECGGQQYSQCDGHKLKVGTGPEDPLGEFTRFVSEPPIPSIKDAETGEQISWGDGAYGYVARCVNTCCNSKCLAEEEEASAIVCQVDYDAKVDLISLPVDLLCSYLVSTVVETKPGHGSKPVRVVEKRIIRNDCPADLAWISELNPEKDKVVIISYANGELERDLVMGEVVHIFKRLWGANFFNGKGDVVCNKPDLLSHVEEIEEAVALPPIKAMMAITLEKAKAIWLHNAVQADITNTLAELPLESTLLIHCIGQASASALIVPRHIYGGAKLYAADFKAASQWRRRRIKLFYLSPSPRSDQTETLIGVDGKGFVYELIRDCPGLATMICFRWSLARNIVKSITELFYAFYLPPGGEGLGEPSKALMEARDTVYTDFDLGESELYYAWAAPLLITQRPAITPSDEGPSPDPGAEFDMIYKRIGTIEDQAIEKLKSRLQAGISDKHKTIYESLEKLIRDQFSTRRGELGTREKPVALDHMREIKTQAERFVPEVLEKLSMGILSGELSSAEEALEAFCKLVQAL